jgi:hypothetical protein
MVYHVFYQAGKSPSLEGEEGFGLVHRPTAYF